MAVQISQYGAEAQRNIRIMEQNRVHLTKWEKTFLASVRVKDPNQLRSGESRKLQQIGRECQQRAARSAAVAQAQGHQ